MEQSEFSSRLYVYTEQSFHERYTDRRYSLNVATLTGANRHTRIWRRVIIALSDHVSKSRVYKQQVWRNDEKYMCY